MTRPDVLPRHDQLGIELRVHVILDVLDQLGLLSQAQVHQMAVGFAFRVGNSPLDHLFSFFDLWEMVVQLSSSLYLPTQHLMTNR